MMRNTLPPLASNDLFDCVHEKARRDEPPKAATATMPSEPPIIQQYNTLKLHAPNQGPRDHALNNVNPKPAMPPSKKPIHKRLIVRKRWSNKTKAAVGTSNAPEKMAVQ